MARCAWCRKKTHLNITCKWCTRVHCTACLLVENHECPNIADMKQENHHMLESKLLREKVVGSKITKI